MSDTALARLIAAAADLIGMVEDVESVSLGGPFHPEVSINVADGTTEAEVVAVLDRMRDVVESVRRPPKVFCSQCGQLVALNMADPAFVPPPRRPANGTLGFHMRYLAHTSDGICPASNTVWPDTSGAEPCHTCDGNGCEEGCGARGGCEMAYAGPDSHKVCPACEGSGREAS